VSGLAWAAIGLTASIAVAGMTLTLALGRRLHEVQEQLRAIGLPWDSALPGPGTPVPDFAVAAADGVTLSTADLAGADTFVAFLSSACQSCRDELPRLREVLARYPVPIAVVVGSPVERAEMATGLPSVAHVVMEDDADDRGLAARFGIRHFPAFLLVGEGVVRSAGHSVEEVLVGVPR
jgi:thiol-disulfide isomerase/thioredoxin